MNLAALEFQTDAFGAEEVAGLRVERVARAAIQLMLDAEAPKYAAMPSAARKEFLAGTYGEREAEFAIKVVGAMLAEEDAAIRCMFTDPEIVKLARAIDAEGCL